MKTLIDQLLSNAVSSDNDIQEEARLALLFLMEYNRKDVHNEELKRYYRNYFPADFIGIHIGAELEQYIVAQVIEIIREVDHYTDPGLLITLSWAENTAAVDALLSLMLDFPTNYRPRVALHAITGLLHHLWSEYHGPPLPALVQLLKTKSPKPFLERIIQDQLDLETTAKAQYALEHIERYLDRATT
jgi:hypothetical protein